MVLHIGNQWHCYYTAHPNNKGADYARTSGDLLHWGPERMVAAGGRSGVGPYSAECPFVVEPLPGHYYLFRTQQYGSRVRPWSITRATHWISASSNRSQGTVPNFRGTVDIASKNERLRRENGTVPFRRRKGTVPCFRSSHTRMAELSAEKRDSPRLPRERLPASTTTRSTTSLPCPWRRRRSSRTQGAGTWLLCCQVSKASRSWVWNGCQAAEQRQEHTPSQRPLKLPFFTPGRRIRGNWEVRASDWLRETPRIRRNSATCNFKGRGQVLRPGGTRAAWPSRPRRLSGPGVS